METIYKILKKKKIKASFHIFLYLNNHYNYLTIKKCAITTYNIHTKKVILITEKNAISAPEKLTSANVKNNIGDKRK